MAETPSTPSIDWLYEVEDVAAYFGVTIQTVRRWISTGELQTYRVPRPRDLNPDADPKNRKTKYKPASESRSNLYITWPDIMAKARVFYGIEDKKK